MADLLELIASSSNSGPSLSIKRDASFFFEQEIPEDVFDPSIRPAEVVLTLCPCKRHFNIACSESADIRQPARCFSATKVYTTVVPIVPHLIISEMGRIQILG